MAAARHLLRFLRTFRISTRSNFFHLFSGLPTGRTRRELRFAPSRESTSSSQSQKSLQSPWKPEQYGLENSNAACHAMLKGATTSSAGEHVERRSRSSEVSISGIVHVPSKVKLDAFRALLFKTLTTYMKKRYPQKEVRLARARADDLRETVMLGRERPSHASLEQNRRVHPPPQYSAVLSIVHRTAQMHTHQPGSVLGSSSHFMG